MPKVKLFSITISSFCRTLQSEIIRFIMKKVVAVLLAIALSPVVMAQDRNVRLDLFGAANVVGASYDARFKGDSGLGFAVGVGYGFGIGNWYEIHGVGVPVEINYLAGRGKHHFEIGAGMSNGVYFDKITESKTVTLPDGSTGTAPKEVRTTQWGNFLYANVGYRLRAENGLVFRCGLSPSYGIGKYGLSKSVFSPYLSLGYSF